MTLHLLGTKQGPHLALWRLHVAFGPPQKASQIQAEGTSGSYQQHLDAPGRACEALQPWV